MLHIFVVIFKTQITLTISGLLHFFKDPCAKLKLIDGTVLMNHIIEELRQVRKRIGLRGYF
jgi:flagellar biosynthesis regulator FlbT